MDHIKVLKRAWQIVKQYRSLWWIGLVLVLVGGGIGGAGSGGPSGSGTSWRTSAPQGQQPFGPMPDLPNIPNMPSWEEIWAGIAAAVAVIISLVVVLACVAIIFSIAATVVRYVTRVSLVKMVNAYEETGEQAGFKAGFRMGWSRSALRLFLLDLMVTLPLVLAMIVLIVPLGMMAFAAFSAAQPNVVLGVVAIVAALPVILLGIALGVVLGPIRELAYRTIALEDLGPWEAFKTTVALVRRHLGPAALQWLILIGLRIAWAIVLVPVNLVLVFVALLIGGLPGLLVGGIAAYAGSWPLGLILGGLVFLPIFIVVIAVPNVALNTLATVFLSTTWTLTYRELRVLDGGAADKALAVGEAELDDDKGTEVAKVKAP
jgi:hypothetical protein